ncbi:unnamed protein product [Polarella glacialis]|uniref:AB hydrolase-1 domain-containing protein n=1 Tax=Polarella glacialis TaxID=89957 RepID=A0A813H7P7_POLGL|nr:unnamed protein product [Polarella glacialis]
MCGGAGAVASLRAALRARSSLLRSALPHVVRGTAVLCATGAIGTVAVTGYVLNGVHCSRRRDYADEFVLTPEDLNMPYHEVQFFTEDGVSLTGWFIPQSSGGRPSRRVIVCCHPHNSSKSNLLGVARGLWDRRYSVFMFDFRSFAHTKTRQSVGYFEQRDARAAVRCARLTAPEGSEIGLIGASMGGAVALMVGHEAEVGAVGIATDCAFANLEDVLETAVSGALRLPLPAVAVIVWLAGVLNPLLFGYRLSDVSPVAAVASGALAGEVPLLIMHAEGDAIVAVSQAHAIHSAAAVSADQKELVVVQHCQHIGCFFRDRPAYVRRLVDFFDVAFASAEARNAAREPKSQRSQRRDGFVPEPASSMPDARTE